MLVKVAPSRGAGDGVCVNAARYRCGRVIALSTAYAHVPGRADAPFALDDHTSRIAAPLSGATVLDPPRSNRRSRDVPEGAGVVLLGYDRDHDAETTGGELINEAIATGL